MRHNHLLALAATGLLLAATAACGADSSTEATKTLTWASTGGQFQEDEKKALQEPFTAKTGTTFVNVSPADASQVKAMVASGNTTWDLANMSWIYAGAYCGELYEKLDDPALDRSKFPPGTTHDCFVPTYRYANVFSYNADMFKGEAPSKIADFFDVKRFPGKRIVHDYPKSGLLEAALVADGVAPDKVYPLDLERALRKLDTIKSSLVFAPSYGAIQQMMVDKQGSMVLTVTARSIVTAQSGANLKAVWDFTTVDIGALVIPKGSPQQGAGPAGARLRHRTGPGQDVRRADRHGARAYRRGHLQHRVQRRRRRPSTRSCPTAAPCSSRTSPGGSRTPTWSPSAGRAGRSAR